MKNNICLMQVFILFSLLVSCGSNKTDNPVVTILSPSNGETVSGVVHFVVSIVDPSGNDFLIDFIVDDALVPMAGPFVSPFEVTYDSTLKTNGVHRFKFMAIDSWGGQGSDQIELNISNP